MLADITLIGSIVAYSQRFEKGRIVELSKFSPQHKTALLNLNKRFVDLADPFDKKYYYNPKFNGKFSIKTVLPALFPNDEELDYKKLGSIQNGSDAMNTFANLYRLKDKSKRENIRKDLLQYCRLDTLAMVKIWEKLYEIIDIDK